MTLMTLWQKALDFFRRIFTGHAPALPDNPYTSDGEFVMEDMTNAFLYTKGFLKPRLFRQLGRIYRIKKKYLRSGKHNRLMMRKARRKRHTAQQGGRHVG